MGISVFDLFKIGIGPSSSHTVGPMVAASRFVDGLKQTGQQAVRLKVEFFGSLALTGKGHWSDKAVILGLMGYQPQSFDPDKASEILATVQHEKGLYVNDIFCPFDPDRDIFFHQRKRLPFHSNAMQFSAYDENGACLSQALFYSIGGGFVLNAEEAGRNALSDDGACQTYDFHSAQHLLQLCHDNQLSIAELMCENEKATRSAQEIAEGLDQIWSVMRACIDRGCEGEGVLPGGLDVPRRAPKLYQSLMNKCADKANEPLSAMDWINLWAIAVNEENASNGRVVTAPTNGAAGIIPAVIKYYEHFCDGNREGIHVFLLTAGAIGALYKRNASISGAEVGCQGEVGVACSMAAAGLTAALGGSPEQIENAAEIGMEHNLGLTCDPIAGLVQIPCIERNAMGAVKAIDASRLALMGDGSHLVSLDKVIATMRQTGRDMKDKYKETSKGGLAVNVVEC